MKIRIDLKVVLLVVGSIVGPGSVSQAVVDSPRTPAKGEFNGLFRVVNFHGKAKFYSKEGGPSFRLFLDGLRASSDQVEPFLQTSSELVGYENQKKQTFHLLNRMGWEVFSTSLENSNIQDVEIQGHFLKFVRNDAGDDRIHIINSWGKEIFTKKLKYVRNLDLHYNYLKYEDRLFHRIYILGVKGQELLNRDLSTPEAIDDKTPGLVDYQFADHFFALVEKTKGLNGQYQLSVRDERGEFFRQEGIIHGPNLSTSLVVYTEALSGVAMLHVRDQLGTEIFNVPAYQVENLEVFGGFIKYRTVIDGEIHVLGSSGVEIGNSRVFVFDEASIQFSNTFFAFVDVRTQYLYVFNALAQVLVNMPVSSVDGEVQMSDHFVGFFDSQSPRGLHIMNPSGQEILHTDKGVREVVLD